MSIVKVFGADCCGGFKDTANIVGVATTVDLFDSTRSYPTIFHPEKAVVHYCLDCYREQVIVPAENEAPRAKDGERHEQQMRDYGYMFRKKVVRNWQEKRFFGK
jgi:hypothetical protein